MSTDPQQTQNTLTEILVQARHRNAGLVETHHELGREQIQIMDEFDSSGLMKLIPGAVIQTNSRGETLVFMRNAGERQVAVFLDGALLNIPWDNRLDLSLVPAAAIGAIDVFTGVSSVQFGPNVVGGALEMSTRMYDADDPTVQAELIGGTQNLLQASITHSGYGNNLDYLTSVTHNRHDGLPVADSASLPFSQNGSTRRTNTDTESTSILLRGNLDISSHVELGMTAFLSDTDKGVAPEAHLDPGQENVRFWRYPDTQNLLVILNGRLNSAGQTTLKGTFWVQQFDQTIDSFTDSTYTQLDEQQFEENLTLGGRLIWHKQYGVNSLLMAFNGLVTEHEQNNSGFITGPRLEFGKRLLSVSSEYDVEVSDNIALKLGLAVNWMATTKTGDKPSISDFFEYDATFAAIYHRADWSFRAGFARKTRLPTLRELFGVSLNRFLINPELQSETNLLGELAIDWGRPGIQLGLAGFASFTSDTIDQHTVSQQGRSLRQRINLRGSRVIGIELSGQFAVNENIRVDGHFALMDIDRRKDSFFEPGTLAEKPASIGHLTVHYEPPGRLSGTFEVEHRGRAYSPDSLGRFVPLKISTSFNLRAAYSLPAGFSASRESEIFLRLNNITDTLIEPQLGLPGAGRWFTAGVRLAF